MSDEGQKDAARGDIEFAYNFCDNQFGWHARNLDGRADECFVSNPCAPYKSITVKEFFGDE